MQLQSPQLSKFNRANWFETSVGQSIVRDEIARCVSLVPSGYYASSLQVGLHGFDYLADLEVAERFVVNTSTQQGDFPQDVVSNCHCVISSSNAMPFPERSQDLVLLPHTLDFCADPHEVLRQVDQILVAEGCMVVVGFNALSFYGAIRLMKGHGKPVPWCGHYYGVRRVQDWLALLGYDLAAAGMFSYLPPIQSDKWRKKLQFFENAGDRWWPGLGGIYVIVGRKREISVTPVTRNTRTWKNLIPGMAQPASQRAAKLGLRIVQKN